MHKPLHLSFLGETWDKPCLNVMALLLCILYVFSKISLKYANVSCFFVSVPKAIPMCGFCVWKKILQEHGLSMSFSFISHSTQPIAYWVDGQKLLVNQLFSCRPQLRMGWVLDKYYWLPPWLLKLMISLHLVLKLYHILWNYNLDVRICIFRHSTTYQRNN